MIRPRPFMNRLVKPVYLQNVKPKLRTKMNFQIRKYSNLPPGDPDNKPNIPYWVLAIMGVYIICNSPRNPPQLT
jgi:hypothetical protein